MAYTDKYIIAFKGLKNSKHEFEFTIEDEFFESFEQSAITCGNINIQASLDKKSHVLAFRFVLSGVVVQKCDRCLEDMEIPIEYQANLYVGFGEENSDITDVDETMTIARNEQELNLSQHFFEYINLSLPLRIVHPEKDSGESDCNEQMIDKLSELAVPEDEETDPRWEKLKSLLN